MLEPLWGMREASRNVCRVKGARSLEFCLTLSGRGCISKSSFLPSLLCHILIVGTCIESSIRHTPQRLVILSLFTSTLSLTFFCLL